MRRTRLLLAAIAVALIAQSAPAQQKDADGRHDSPLVTRFPGSRLGGCKDSPDDTAKLPLAKGDKTIEGEIHRADYQYPSTASKPQVIRNLVTALKAAGYTQDYDSGNGDLVFHKGGQWVWESVSSGGGYVQITVKEIELKQEVTADANAMSSSINSSGHASLYGILFDTGKADIKPESKPSLDEVAKLLKNDLKLKLYVVGHTDNVGGLTSNMQLSQQRAAAVVKALTTDYGIPAARLAPYGDGPYAPVASNDSEDGRKMNRRVELVKQ